MYESFFGLNALPFKITPDPAFIYWNKQHRRAASILAFGIEQLVPITVVTGDVGAGKTTLLQQFLEEAPTDMTVGLISNYWSGMGGLYQWILNAFDLKASGSEVALFRVFQDFVVSEYAAGRRCVLIVDEAQNVSDPDLEQLRMLTNINAGKDSLFMLFLVGQPQLRDRLRQPNNNQIAQRVGAAFHLGAMSAEDTVNYVRHRLKVAGATRDIFDDGALMRVHQVSGGVPRLINVVCELALVAAFGDEVDTIDSAYLDTFLAEAAENGMMAHLPVTLTAKGTEVTPPRDAPLPSSPVTIGRSGQRAQRIRLVTHPPLQNDPEDQPLIARDRSVTELAEQADPETAQPEEAEIMESVMASRLARPSGAQQDTAQTGTGNAGEDAAVEIEEDPPRAEKSDEGDRPYRLDDSELVDLPELFDRVASVKQPEGSAVADVVSQHDTGDQDPDQPIPVETRASETGVALGSSSAGPAARNLTLAAIDHGLDAALALLLAGAVIYSAILPQDRNQAPQMPATPDLVTTPEISPATAPIQTPGEPAPALDETRNLPLTPLEDPGGAALLERALDGGAGAPLDYARAALRGEARAAYYLGQLYETGDGVPRDLALARAWYELSGPNLRSGKRRLAELGPPETGDLAAPRPVLGGPLADGGGELIWTGGDGADAPLYLVELAETPDGPARRLAPQKLSAQRVDDLGKARIWRVLAVDPVGGRYAASAWQPLGADPQTGSDDPAPVAPQVTVLLPADISPAQKTLATERLVSAGFQFSTRSGEGGNAVAPTITHAYETDREIAKLVADLFGTQAAVKLGPVAGQDGVPPLPGAITVTLPAP